MHLKSLLTAYMRTLLAGLVVCCGIPVPAAAADDYLSILEAEADSTASVAGADDAVEEVVHNRHGKTDFGSSKLVTPGLSFDEFEAELDSRYSGSHLLYIRLSRHERKQVYHAYQDDNRISSIRKEIVRLLSAG